MVGLKIRTLILLHLFVFCCCCFFLKSFLGGGLILAKANLVELDLSDNALGPVGMEGLVQFLKSPVCYSLKCIRLNNNGLGIYGGRVIQQELINF